MKKNSIIFVILACTIFSAFSQTRYSRKVEKCTFPDGKIADAYIFAKSNDAVKWQNEKWYSYPSNSPLDPYFKAFKQNGMQGSNVSISPISYYMPKDFGNLAQYLTLKSAVMGVYEDSAGVYLLMISSPELHIGTGLDKKTAKAHKGQLVYKTVYVPKANYKPVTPVRLTPAKITPVSPSTIPDASKNLFPIITDTSSAYYYDSILANQLQWLSVKIACIGKYDMAYTGDFKAKNPLDNYTTSYIKSYLAKNGSTTRGTITFEGICFDYADCAYQELSKNKRNYNNVKDFWMVSTFTNSNEIVTYRLANNSENPTMTINGSPVVVYTHEKIKAHGDATNHAWFWIQSTAGTVYWIDPTWTDNTGRPVYGIVRNGREESLTPSEELCVK